MDCYFVVAPEAYKHHVILVMPDNDYLPLGSNINAFPLYTDETKVIVKTRIEADNMAGWLEETNTIEDQFGPEAVTYVGMTATYIGSTWESVESAYPELTTPIEIDGELISKLSDTIIL